MRRSSFAPYEVAWAAVLALSGCLPHEGNAPADAPDSLAARRQIWAAIVPQARAAGIDPGFVYALVKAESNFDPHATRRGGARGLLQIKPDIWRAASSLPYETAAWNWRENLSVGMGHLATIKRSLEDRHVFTYPLLWASFHYGPDYVEAHGFDMSRIPRPADPVSYRLFAGDIHPLAPPR